MTNAKPIQALAAALLLAFLAACAPQHSVPPRSFAYPPSEAQDQTLEVFVDVNGTFYSEDWEEYLTDIRDLVQDKKSLLNATWQKPEARQRIHDGEREVLSEFEGYIEDAERVFVFTHGFNNLHSDAQGPLSRIGEKIALRDSDRVVHFYWDGLRANGLTRNSQSVVVQLTRAKIWFEATGYSQLAGMHGLRRLLNRIKGKEIIIVSHSRGASVVLSALGNPPFDRDFVSKTMELDFAKPDYPGTFEGSFFSPYPVRENGNTIRAVFLAPAIGYPDFWAADCETRPAKDPCLDPPRSGSQNGQCEDYRDFSPQLKAIRFTMNDDDKALTKIWSRLGRYFNATDLGFNQEVGDRLAGCISFTLDGVQLANHDHSFSKYVDNPMFLTMLNDIGVATVPPSQ